jgi:hypothetical protein
VNEARGRHGTGQKGEGSARSVGVGVAIPRHLGAPTPYRATLVRAPFSRSLSTSGSHSCPLRLTSERRLPQNSWMRPASAITCRRSSRLASLRQDRRDLSCHRPSAPKEYCAAVWTGPSHGRSDLLQCIQDRLVGVLRAASVLLADVDVITVRVDDVPIARADERRWLTVALLAGPASILTSCELLQLRNWHSEVQNHEVHADLRSATGHERVRWKHEPHADGEYRSFLLLDGSQ